MNTRAIAGFLLLSTHALLGGSNVLLIIADDYGIDSSTLYNSTSTGATLPPTPNISALASGGVLFTHAYSAPVCSPARACVESKLAQPKYKVEIRIVAATNHPEELDAALVRPGRFDCKIEIPLPDLEARSTGADQELRLSFSEVASFLDCGMAYRLRNLVGFQPRLAPELGYGKAVHHVLRMVAEPRSNRPR